MAESDAILARLDELEPLSRALEEGPEERRALTDRVVAFADRMLDGAESNPENETSFPLTEYGSGK